MGASLALSACEVLSGLSAIENHAGSGDDARDSSDSERGPRDDSAIAVDTGSTASDDDNLPKGDAPPPPNASDDGPPPPDASKDALPGTDAPPDSSDLLDASPPRDGSQDSPACVVRGPPSNVPTVKITGGRFRMGETGVPNATPHQVDVDSFALDTDEVSVGRFLTFVDDFDCWHLRAPAAEAGRIGSVNGTGWNPEWSRLLPPNSKAFGEELLACGSDASTASTTHVGSDRALPVNCVTWYEAFAFCLWDGGRLPTEAEWEFAAAGGDKQKPYPSGYSPPTLNEATFAPWSGPTATGAHFTFEPFRVRDIAGNVAEWVLDPSGPYGADCSAAPCLWAPTTSLANRGARGGSWRDEANSLRTARRDAFVPTDRSDTLGLRCVRPWDGSE